MYPQNLTRFSGPTLTGERYQCYIVCTMTVHKLYTDCTNMVQP
jgi:hypothetical protein